MREGELVLEVEDQSTNNYEREIGALVREVEGQSAMTYEKEVGQSNRRYLCWICGDRPFNARHQLVDHIEGAGGGGKIPFENAKALDRSRPTNARRLVANLRKRYDRGQHLF